jgi:hydroxyacylglutathione hydrolase
MIIKMLKVGGLRTNCYIVADKPGGEALVIDPGDEAKVILPELHGLTVKLIVLTHGHYDHVGAVAALKKETGAEAAGHFGDRWMFQTDRELKDSEMITIGQLTFQVIHTPGHSAGGLCLYTPGHLFSGDTLFYRTYGRTDLKGGSEQAMVDSLSCLAKLPPETVVHPGHGRETTIGDEAGSGLLD